MTIEGLFKKYENAYDDIMFDKFIQITRYFVIAQQTEMDIGNIKAME